MSKSAPTSTRPNLVIVGSGWGGFYLAEHLSLTQFNVTLLSPRRTSAYTPLLASAAVGLFNFYLAEEPVRSKSRSALRFLKANVVDVDFGLKQCICAPAFDDDDEEDTDLASQTFVVDYDVLVLAPGCVPNTFNTPGVAEHAIFIKNVSDAMRVRKRLFDLLEKASLPDVSVQRARELLHIAIVGGGPTGIELTAELDDLCRHEIRHVYPAVADYMSISIYDVAPNILSAYDKNLHEYAAAQLARRDVQVCPNTRIERVDRTAIHIQDRGRVPYGMLIWATGNKHVDLVEKLQQQRNVRTSEKGLKRILTDDRCRVFKSNTPHQTEEVSAAAVHDGVFAIGDAADIEGASLPTTAEVAVQKAKYLVDHFSQIHFSSGSSSPSTKLATPEKPFHYRQTQLVSYIGQHDGVIAGKGPNSPGWTGRSAWLAWRGGSLLWNRNWRSRVVILVTWLLNLLLGKEIARM